MAERSTRTPRRSSTAERTAQAAGRGSPAEPTVPPPPPVPAAEPAAPGAPTVGAQEPTRAQEAFATPPVDIYEDDEGLVVVADLPGVEPGALDVRVDHGLLTIQGRARALAAGTPLHREYALTGFYRQFQLPEEIDAARIAADLQQGVLTLRLPRAAPAPPRRIDVRTG